MVIMEGFLLTPPDRGSIIGRASRYVVLGRNIESRNPSTTTSLVEKPIRSRMILRTSSKSDLVDTSDTAEDQTQIYLKIFKAKGELESVAHHPILDLQSCEVRSIQHRKQSPPLPTLILEFKTDVTTSRLRKRRSSKASLTPKDGNTYTVLFRSIEGECHSIFDWVVQIKLLLSLPAETEDKSMNNYVNFTNQFMNRSSSSLTRKPDSYGKSLHQINTSSSHTSLRKNSDVISSSPSLRSRRSDLSSKASSLAQVPGLTGSLTYASGISSGLPSPTLTKGHDHKSIEGWTSAHARTSALSSHTRGSSSIASAITNSINRETILDRAFQMRYIPGSERMSAAEDASNLSSTARFEALMREKDERKRAKSDFKSKKELSDAGTEENDLRNIVEDMEDDLYLSDQGSVLPVPAQRALDFISGRRCSLKEVSSPPPQHQSLYLNSEALSALSGNDESTNDGESARLRSDMVPIKSYSRPTIIAIPQSPISSVAVPVKKDNSSNNNNNSNNKIDSKEKRQSSSSAKRLSFQEFARRLSSTSSLLMAPTNASSNSGRGSGDYSSELSANSRGCSTKDDRDQQCSWRGSVCPLSVEGNFL
ncbi:hypothetical protein GcM3_083021 [Golovinomyces cichoracearum]|uniref:Uncharacterized protein n=1 Tax=Golovinomyces cichoracearum TaxID=62708 RepID=A0A420IM50_9PEZI|nr:hypothetical protein GcM3_083021 [Golovinomyces cichoracearum]